MPQIFENTSLLMREVIGTAEGDDGTVYELAHAGTGAQLVKSSKTGRTFALSWSEVVEMAIAAGVNEEPARIVIAPSTITPQ